MRSSESMVDMTKQLFRARSWMAGGALVAALVAAGCGSSGSTTQAKTPQTMPATTTSKPAPATAPQTTPAKPAAPPVAKKNPGIPQNGGGDGDADNSGGPNDGDGNL